MVLPFGTADSDFDILNRTMFSEDWKWLSNDMIRWTLGGDSSPPLYQSNEEVSYHQSVTLKT